MDPLIIVLGILAAIGAVAFFISAFVDENIIWLGVAAACAVGAYFGIYTGVHHEFMKFHAKHDAILVDLRAQGFNLASSDVFAIHGDYYTGTEADLPLGKCSVPFIARYIDGAWHVALPARNPTNLVVLTPDQVAAIGSVCK